MKQHSALAGLERLRATRAALAHELEVYRLVLAHERTPMLSRLLLGLALAYLLLPFDLIPDFIPILGQLDDLIIVPILVLLAMKMVPRTVVEDCRARVMASSGEDNDDKPQSPSSG